MNFGAFPLTYFFLIYLIHVIAYQTEAFSLLHILYDLEAALYIDIGATFRVAPVLVDNRVRSASLAPWNVVPWR